MENSTPKQKNKTKASEIIQLRNRFFYIYYRRLSLLFLISLGICIFSMMCAFYFATKKTPPIYLPVSADGRLIQSFSLSKPSFEDKELMVSTVMQWAVEGVRKFYTLDYINYTDQIFEAQPFFTIRGWNRTFTAFESSQNLNTVIAQKMIVNMIPMGPPSIIDERIIDGRLAWAVEFPAQLRYIPHDGRSQGFVQTGTFKLVIMRVALVDSAKGIGIDQLVFVQQSDR